MRRAIKDLGTEEESEPHLSPLIHRMEGKASRCRRSMRRNGGFKAQLRWGSVQWAKHLIMIFDFVLHLSDPVLTTY